MSSPAATNPAPGFVKHPNYRLVAEPCRKRIRAELNGETIADSLDVKIVLERGITPVYYFPPADVRLDLMEQTDRHTHCPFKGDATYRTIRVGERSADDAAWSYDAPYDEWADLDGYVAFYWNRMDHWFEEDDEVFVHARDPHVRIDIANSSRPVEVVLGGETVARSSAARFLFETGLPVRYYLPRQDVRTDLLRDSATATACPYKGTASYYSTRIGDTDFEDIAWIYRHPVAEAAQIADYICFYNERVDQISVDGQVMDRPVTKWSK